MQRKNLMRQLNIANIPPAGDEGSMRSVVQRVDMAGVSVGGRMISSIEKGLLVFLGVERSDKEVDADFLLEKIINLRVFEDTQGKMNLSLIDTSGGMLIISQFTLLADCRKGRRPSFTAAADPEDARRLYDYFVAKARETIKHVGAGEFQAMMKIDSINDGPVTLMLDSRKQF